jgi:Periplasmic binding protein
MKRWRTSAVVVALTVMVAAGCSSNSHKSNAGSSTEGTNSSSSGQPSGSSTTGGTGGGSVPTVKLMVLADLTGQLNHFPEVVAGAKAAADAVNNEGKVKIDLVECDPGWDPNKGAACGRQAVADKVAAVIAYDGIGGWIGSLAAANIPCIGCSGYSVGEAQSPMYYQLGTGGPTPFAGDGWYAGAANLMPMYGTVVQGFATTISNLNFANVGLATWGDKIAKVVAISSTATDISPYVQQLLAGSPKLIQSNTGHPIDTEISLGLQSAGYHGTISLISESLSPEWVQQLGSAANGMVFSGALPPVTDTSYPGISEFQQEWKASGATADQNEGALDAWAAVHVIANLMQGKSSGSSATLLQAMKSAGTINFAPLPPFNWGQAPIKAFLPNRVYSSDAFISRLENGVLQPIYKNYIDTLSKNVPSS